MKVHISAVYACSRIKKIFYTSSTMTSVLGKEPTLICYCFRNGSKLFV